MAQLDPKDLQEHLDQLDLQELQEQLAQPDWQGQQGLQELRGRLVRRDQPEQPDLKE
ncbi:hypothetical protein [Cohnella kolymensis]|uniref:hypothetical protein n=1 Tax=Cohnella kolymensis TaxID=1590652 RepID=UPI000B0876B5|nr:hypothetical protein [Cohnella kolymensis]